MAALPIKLFTAQHTPCVLHQLMHAPLDVQAHTSYTLTQWLAAVTTHHIFTHFSLLGPF